MDVAGAFAAQANSAALAARATPLHISGASFAPFDYTPALRIGGEGVGAAAFPPAALAAALAAANPRNRTAGCRPGALRTPLGDAVAVTLRNGSCPNNTAARAFAHCVQLCAAVDAAAAAAAAAAQAAALGALPGPVFVLAGERPCVTLEQLSKGSLAATAAAATRWGSDISVYLYIYRYTYIYI